MPGIFLVRTFLYIQLAECVVVCGGVVNVFVWKE